MSALATQIYAIAYKFNHFKMKECENNDNS